MDVRHFNLKPHIDKLVKMKIIDKDETHKGNVVYYKISDRGYDWMKACSKIGIPIPQFKLKGTMKKFKFIN